MNWKSIHDKDFKLDEFYLWCDTSRDDCYRYFAARCIEEEFFNGTVFMLKGAPSWNIYDYLDENYLWCEIEGPK